MILDQGFAWNGTAHSSLSQVAKAITGASCNSHRFFGLRFGLTQNLAANEHLQYWPWIHEVCASTGGFPGSKIASLRAARERLAKRPRDSPRVRPVGHLRILSQDLLEGARDLTLFEIRLSAIDSLSRGSEPGKPLAKVPTIESPSTSSTHPT